VSDADNMERPQGWPEEAKRVNLKEPKAYQKLPLAAMLNCDESAVVPQRGPLFSGRGGGQPGGSGPTGGGPPGKEKRNR
jgi:hypothetical protein